MVGACLDEQLGAPFDCRQLRGRVLGPRDYLGDRAGRDGVFPAGSEMNFRVHVDASGLGASGYRLYVFYR